MGLARTGAAGSNGSGDYAIAFSTLLEVRVGASRDSSGRNSPLSIKVVGNEAMSPLCLAIIEATEEAIYNSVFRATTITGRGHTAEASRSIALKFCAGMTLWDVSNHTSIPLGHWRDDLVTFASYLCLVY